MASEGEEKEARMGSLISVWEELRSYLGIVALLAIGLPAVVLVLTLLADSSRPLPTQASDGGVGRGEVAHRQDHPEGRRLGGSGEGDVRSLSQGNEGAPPAGGSGADRTDPTRQPARNQKVADREQDSPNAADALATSTASAAAPTTAEPTSVGIPTPPVATATAPATAPATTSAPATAEAATASPQPTFAQESSAPTIATPAPTPVEVPMDGVQGLVSDPQLRGPSK